MHILTEGIQVAYDDKGSGRVVVLLHGWGTSKDNFAELVTVLAKEYRVIAVDFPGFGESGKPPLDWRVGDFAAFVADFLRQLHIDDVHAFIAHSFGGRVCIKGLSTNTLSADKLVLIGSAGVEHSRSVRNVAFAAIAKAGKLVMRLPVLSKKYDEIRKKLYEKAGSEDYVDSGDMHRIFLNTIHEDLRGAARTLTLPTLLIWGSEDTEAPLSDARFFEGAIRGAKLKIIQGASHFVHNEHPEKAARWIQEFLA